MVTYSMEVPLPCGPMRTPPQSPGAGEVDPDVRVMPCGAVPFATSEPGCPSAPTRSAAPGFPPVLGANSTVVPGEMVSTGLLGPPTMTVAAAVQIQLASRVIL